MGINKDALISVHSGLCVIIPPLLAVFRLCLRTTGHCFMILKSNKIRDFNEGEVFYKALNSSFTAKNRDVLIILSRQSRYEILLVAPLRKGFNIFSSEKAPEIQKGPKNLKETNLPPLGIVQNFSEKILMNPRH